jgi:predicted nucleotidyltransferase
MVDIETIKFCVEPIAKDYGIKKIYLFGSYAKGTANEDSDVDLLIEKGSFLYNSSIGNSGKGG